MDATADAPDRALIQQYRDTPDDLETVARNRQTLIDAIDAAQAGNWDAYWDIFDPDVTFHEAACLPYGGAHRGLEATKRAYGQIGEVFSTLRSVLETVLAAGDKVILYQTITFRVQANGNSGTFPVAELFRFEDGKVIEWRALYFDSDMVCRAIAGGK